MTSVSLAGKTAIVTGATSGMGRATAVAAAAAGANVVAVGRDAARLADVVAEIEAAGGTVTPAAYDLVQAGAPQAVVDLAVSTYGGLQVVINCAGIWDGGLFGDPAGGGIEAVDRVLDVNLRAPYRLAEAALPHLEAGSSILFFSSTMARFGIAWGTAYSISKGAVEAMMRVLAVELGSRGIRVNALTPGWIRTPMNEPAREDPSVEAFAASATPLGRIGEAHEVAAVAVFLASDAASYVHGTVMQVEGGYPMLPAADMLDNA